MPVINPGVTGVQDGRDAGCAQAGPQPPGLSPPARAAGRSVRNRRKCSRSAQSKENLSTAIQASSQLTLDLRRSRSETREWAGLLPDLTWFAAEVGLEAGNVTSSLQSRPAPRWRYPMAAAASPLRQSSPGTALVPAWQRRSPKLAPGRTRPSRRLRQPVQRRLRLPQKEARGRRLGRESG